MPTLKPVSKCVNRTEMLAMSISQVKRDRSKARHFLLQQKGDLEEVKVNLMSPISSQMKNTFISKSTSKNMDHLYRNLIVKRKLIGANTPAHIPPESGRKRKSALDVTVGTGFGASGRNLL